MPVSVRRDPSTELPDAPRYADRDFDGHEQHELNDLGTAPGTVDDSSVTNAPDRARRRRRGQVSSLSRSRYVPIPAARDHLANERVFLAYIRTSSALANFAVAILQLYRLNRSSAPAGKLSDFDLGVPLATTTLVIAIVLVITGAARFFVCEHAMIQKKVLGSGLVAVMFVAATALVSEILLSCGYGCRH